MITLSDNQVKKLQSDLSLLAGHIAGINELMETIQKVLAPASDTKQNRLSYDFDIHMARSIAKRRRHIAKSVEKAQMKQTEKPDRKSRN